MLAIASGVACWPSMAVATSPGRICVPTKISADTATRSRRPRPMRWAIIFVSGPPNVRTESRRRGLPWSSALVWLTVTICAARLLGEPDADRRAEAGHLVVRVAHPALHLIGMRVDEVVEHRQDQAAVVAHHDRHLPVELLAAGRVELAARLQQQLVEILAEEPRVVPVRLGVIGGGIHGILRRRSEA